MLCFEKFKNFKMLTFRLIHFEKNSKIFMCSMFFPFFYISKKLFMYLLSAFSYTFKNSKAFIIYKNLFIKTNIF